LVTPSSEFIFKALPNGLQLLCREVGDAILAVAEHNTQFKADDSPVTAADVAAHQLLAAGLPKLLDLPVVSEECPAIGRVGVPQQGLFWLVDPLDGTKEFIAGNDDFAVCVALMQDLAPRFGFIYQPRTGIAYWGGAESGSSMGRNSRAAIHKLQARRAHFDEPLVALVSRQGASREASWIQQLSRHWPSGVLQQPMGSALKACALAAGKADFYPRRGRTCIWDTAAAQAILQGAGGEFLNLQGEALRYDAQSLYNPEFIAVADKSLPWLDLLGIR